MSTFITRGVVLAAAAVVSSLTFGLAAAHSAVRPTLGITHGAEHWNYAVRPKNGPHPNLPIIPGGQRGATRGPGYGLGYDM